MEPKTLPIEVHILNSRCGKCQHLAYEHVANWKFVCTSHWQKLPIYVNIGWAKDCPNFKPYEYRIPVSSAVLEIVEKGVK